MSILPSRQDKETKMHALLTIAKRDLASYFASLKGAVVFWFFLMFLGFFFYSFVLTYMQMQKQAAMLGGNTLNIVQLLTAIFNNVHFILLLVVPAITMAAFAEERRNGALRLLLTAPVNTSEIVLGKFFAAMGLMTLVLSASLLFPIFLVKYGAADPAGVFLSYLGLLLLISSQVAFGLWISALTSNQFLAFIFTMFGLFFLLILNWIAPSLASGESGQDVVRYLASGTHLDAFFRGLLTVADTGYFVLFTCTFLFFTHVVLDSQRWR